MILQAKQSDSTVKVSATSKVIPVNKIIRGDCLDVLQELPDNCIDLIVTSPPYGENRKHAYEDLQINGVEANDQQGRY